MRHTKNNANIELLAPAGDLEKLKFAVDYGADAVYLGGKAYGLRAYAGNFSREDIRAGIDYAHSHHKKLYVTVNIIAHNNDLEGLPDFLRDLRRLGVDALIVSDPGIISICKDIVPDMELHLSTQANCTNWRAAKFWKEQGIRRIILARELSVKEIEQMIVKVPGIDFETFVHGSMCLSYSGRCWLSNYIVHRDANRGACAHPCRWRYYLVEAERPGEYFPVFEDEEGTKVMSSKDLSMIRYIPDLLNAGLRKFKIEGRMKSIHYVATVVRAYRKALDAYVADPKNYKISDEWEKELLKTSTRPFTTGFYFNVPGKEDQEYHGGFKDETLKNSYVFVGVVLNQKNGYLVVQQRNHFQVGDRLEIIGPEKDHGEITVKEIINSNGEKVTTAPHPKEVVTIPVDFKCEPQSLIRKIVTK